MLPQDEGVALRRTTQPITRAAGRRHIGEVFESMDCRAGLRLGLDGERCDRRQPGDFRLAILTAGGGAI